MSAESSLTAVAVVRALLNEDTEGLAVLLPDGLPEPGRELMASLASLTVLSAKVAARAEGITEGEYLDRIIRLWTDGQVAGLAGGPVLPRVVDELYARAEGNPFFTEQLVAATLADASEGGLLQAPAGLPARLAELLAARAGRCAGNARAVLAGLAVAGRPLAEEPLAAVTGLDAEAVRGGLRELAAGRLLAEDTSGGEYRPRHALLAEAVAAGLLPGERESGRRTARPDRGRRGRRAGIRLRRGRGALATGHRAGPGTARRGRRDWRDGRGRRGWCRRRGRRRRAAGDRRATDVRPGHRHA
jgi:hypothetical protein